MTLEQKFNPEAADTASTLAGQELQLIFEPAQIAALAEWWTSWVMQAGHRRLYREVKKLAK